MKKILALFLAGSIFLSGCGSSGTKSITSAGVVINTTLLPSFLNNNTVIELSTYSVIVGGLHPIKVGTEMEILETKHGSQCIQIKGTGSDFMNNDCWLFEK